MPIRNKYREYFTIDESYFPCIDDSAIRAGAPWDNTYPHETFISMLEAMKDALDRRNDGKSLWIEGPFGSGKSQCAHALRRILEAPEAELRAYWGAFEPLKKKADLLERLIHHRRSGIAVAYRYASGSIASPRELFFAVQESVKEALERAGATYLGENTIKEAIADWLERPANNDYFNALLKEKEWASLFTQACAGDVVKALRGGGEVKDLMSRISRLSAKEGITAFNLDAERLKNWLRDVIDKNNTKIVLIWDEFSDYFSNNKESLSEFQNIVSLAQEKPFYFNIVTHQTSHTIWEYFDKLSLKRLKDRFETVQITLPPNIAFELIGHAFGATEAAKPTWEKLAGDLNSRLHHSRDKVMKATDIKDQQVIKNIMPLHPVAALLLKNVATNFTFGLANQRSMFNFIKSNSAGGARAFQWFIDTTGPHDDHPLLTADLLWSFVYEKGREDLPPDVRAILDAFGQSKGLREDEEAVLKVILLMQAMDHKLAGAEDLFKATDQNLSYAFEGITSLDGSKPGNLAKGLVDRGILIKKPIAGDRFAYALAVLSGDQAKIDEYKKNVEKQATTAKLVTEGGLATVLALAPALRLRFETEPNTGKITAVTLDDFTRVTNGLKDKKDKNYGGDKWRFHAVLAFAQNDAEAAELRRKIRERVADEAFSHIVFIDALSTPLGQEALERYLDYSAMAAYHQGSNNATSRENADNARRVLDQEWKDRISRGPLVVYTHGDQDGTKYGGAEGVGGLGGALEAIVLAKFPRAFDFARGLSENQLKASQMKSSAQYGIGQGLKEDGGKVTGPIAGVERHALPAVWKMDRYWENPSTSSLPISEMKRKLDEAIEEAFAESGQVSIQDAYDFLEASYGLAPCNLSSFLAGFLLKEYGGEPYRYGDSEGKQEPMTQDKLAEMLGNYIGKTPKPKPTFIVKMNQEEKAFCEFTERAWGIPANSCTSAGQAARAVEAAMRRLGLPVWCLQSQAGGEAYGVIEAYIELVRGGAEEAQGRALTIGRTAAKGRPTLADDLRGLLTREGVQKGMLAYLELESPECGVMALAREIGAQDAALNDVSALFDVKHACLWDRQTGEEEIRKLLTDYGIVKESNAILNVRARSLREALKAWRERLKFCNVPCEALKARYPALSKALDGILRVFGGDDLLPDHLKALHAELSAFGPEIKNVLETERDIFAAEYEPYLEGLSSDEIGELRSKLQIGGLFGSPKTDCNAKVQAAADEYRKNQKKTRLAALWKEKTGTKNPLEWSSKYKTPILCCVPAAEYDRASRAFDALNKHSGTDAEIDDALDFLEKSAIFSDLGDAKRDAAFMRDVVGEYGPLLRDPEKVRDALDSLSIETGAYGWRESPKTKEKIRKLAEAKYNAGGSDRVISVIDGMDDAKLKQYLKDLARKSIELGMAILSDADPTSMGQ
jgi:hypothetical protein